MPERLDRSKLDEALNNLGSLLERDREAEPVHLVVCGGSSMLALGLLENKQFTRDVDVLALIVGQDDDGKALVTARPLPDALRRAALTTAQVMDLFPDWINDGPTNLLAGGLPDGFTDRLETQGYGKKLQVSFIGRLDQIHFKVFAAADSGPGRHLDDLRGLAPTGDELLAAIRWIRGTQDPSDDFATLLRALMRALNHDDLADRV